LVSSPGSLWRQPGTGGLTFWTAVDLVIAQPVSWLPLVADYTRFARSPRAAMGGTFWGYLAGNAWFYALGALLALSAGLADATPVGLAQAIASLAGGWIVMLVLLVGETDEAFANIYSMAVSSLNLRDRTPRSFAIVLAGVAGLLLAAWLGPRPDAGIATFQSFLFLLGSVFVPLFGVFVGDFFILRRGQHERPTPGGPRAATTPSAIRACAFAAWILGFLAYQWSVPTGPGWWQGAMESLLRGLLRLPYPLAGSALGASMPAFVTALGAHLLLVRIATRGARARA
jgi:purine-cytosine permease-like protein